MEVNNETPAQPSVVGPEITQPAPATMPPAQQAPVEAPVAVAEPVAVPAIHVRRSVGVELENLRLQPIELEQPKALYRALLPGILQVPADYVIAAARKSS